MSPKRSLSYPPDDDPKAKRTRTQFIRAIAPQLLPELESNECRQQTQENVAVESTVYTRHHFARCRVQQAISIVLKHDGYHSATKEAMESFTNLVETYLESLISETMRFALSARREHPTPIDFQRTLNYHNLSATSLMPHLDNPVAKIDRPLNSDLMVAAMADDTFQALPTLSSDLSGKSDRIGMKHIPSSFPEFPSQHTYKYTLHDYTTTRDSKMIREEAARTAQQGEDALRRLVRASKMRQQKEAKTLMQRDNQGRERFRLWETMMKRFMGADGHGDHGGQMDVADHSMIVNGDVIYQRKEVARLGKRSGGLSTTTT